jgi:hypothetical protein
MPTVQDRYLDNGLAALKSEATDIYINTAEPATFSAATSGATSLGKKTFGSGAVFPAAIAAGTPNGRQLATAAVTDGAISTGGTAAAVSVVDFANSRLGITTTLSASQAVTASNPFTLGSFTVKAAWCVNRMAAGRIWTPVGCLFSLHKGHP